jgi:16S rRNA (cytosine967-C5)-methyltransferase
VARAAAQAPTRDPRRVALEVLTAVAERDAYANLVLPPLLDRGRLDERDRALATELAYGTLRRQGSLDRLLSLCSTRAVERMDPSVLRALRLGAYQLLYTRVPRHAAVDTAVELAGTGARSARTFANAVLRAAAVRVAGPDPLGLADIADPTERLAAEHSHPRWVVDAFRSALDDDDAELAAALAADNARPEVHLAVLPGRADPDQVARELAGAGLAAHPGRFSPHALILDGGDPGRLASVIGHAVTVQDEGSQLCALALHRAAPAGLVVDLCAGPGGKAALLAALRPRVLAVEPAPARAALVRDLGVPAVARADGRRPPVAPRSAAGVLVDAPCTGLGALRRRPEARWRRTPDDLDDLVRLQRQLLAAAAELVAPGGVLGYAVCSPHPAEADVELPPGFARLDAAGYAGVAGEPRLALWPHRHGTDAMSLTLARRTGDAADR